MATPYWGKLPPLQVSRTNSLKRDPNSNLEREDLRVDTNAKSERLSGQSFARRNRDSTQTDAPTISTQSPFASPVASSFRGDGLAPRPSSFQYHTSEKDYLDKRRRREARNSETYDDNPPPAAPDVPRAPPLSYKQPHSNGAYAAPVRSRSTRKSDGPDLPEEYYRSDAKGNYADTGRTGSKGKEVDRNGSGDWTQDRRASIGTTQPRKGSISEAEAQRRREWAPDRSPLQRLELTLDSITKEEKRARVEEAELIAREAKAGRGGERAPQNSVRFRNRPVAKAPDPSQPEPQTLPDAGLVRNLSTKQKDQLQRSGTVEKKRPTVSETTPKDNGGGFDYQPEVEPSSALQREKSKREKSTLAAAAGAAGAAIGIGRSTSNKLKKDPPGDPWQSRRTDAEKKYPEIIAPRRPYVSDQHTALPTPRGVALGSHPQVSKDKELPSLPKEARAPAIPIAKLDLDSDEDMDGRPVRRGSSKKIAQLTGETTVPQNARALPPSQMYGERTSIGRSASQREPAKNVRTELVTVNGIKYAVTPGTLDTARQAPPHEQHHLSNLLHLHRHDAISNDGYYVPDARLDEWKKGGVVLLDGENLDLAAPEKTEAEKDQAWWEAGNTGRRRRSSTTTKQRKAEAYDAEFDGTTGRESQSFTSEKSRPRKAHRREWTCQQPRERERAALEGDAFLTPRQERRARHAKTRPRWQAAITKASRSGALQANVTDESSSYPFPVVSENSPLFPTLKPNLLTSARTIRVRPETAPTRFKPNLFLKSGPFLRYCGLRREKKQGRVPKNAPRPEREIWRGSVMIVTQDAKSSYELAPTLRLFLQPMELLPPPPAQVDGAVAPEYVDPIAGLSKIGRDGRTLYIRPVEHLEEGQDLSKEESDEGLFELSSSPMDGSSDAKPKHQKLQYDGEKAGRYKEIRGFRLHAEHGVTFWKFNIEVELRDKQQRIAYRINRGPATGFWVPAKDEAMNIMFHSCNGFSYGVDPNAFSGPDPMWRDVLNTHQTQPFHVMLGGGDQIYNDAVQHETTIFERWTEIKDPRHKEHEPFTPELQKELEQFYLDRYCMWFSQGLFGVAVSQIPMVNIFDDHDIIDGFGSYSDRYMRSPVMSGLGAVAFKYYMLFQHQSSIDEGDETEPSWILGAQPGPYINELSRSIFTFLGRSIAFLGLDCRTERMYDEVVSPETYDKVFSRLEKDIIKGETKHLIVLLGVPVAYPRMVWLENILTSRIMEPVKMLSRAGLLGKGLLNNLDGGVEILDDLDDHWTAKHHKDERQFFIEELQELAAEKSVRVTILGGDVHLAAIGQFYSSPKLGIAKDRDHRYMPNIISSAIVNTPPPDALADLLNKRNKVHHLDDKTDEDMIPIFTHDVTGKPRNNKRLLNRRNWCSIRQYNPELSPPPTPDEGSFDGSPSPPVKRGLLRRLSSTKRAPTYRQDGAIDRPPLSSSNFFSRQGSNARRPSIDSQRSQRSGILTRTLSLTRKDFMPGNLFRSNSKSKRRPSDTINGYGSESDEERDPYYPQQQARTGLHGGAGDPHYRHDAPDDEDSYFPTLPRPLGPSQKSNPLAQASTSIAGSQPQIGPNTNTNTNISPPTNPSQPRNNFHRTPTGLSEKQLRKGGTHTRDINLEGGLDICINVEVSPKDPAGITMPYRLLVPRLWYDAEREMEMGLMPKEKLRKNMVLWRQFAAAKGRFGRWRDERGGAGRGIMEGRKGEVEGEMGREEGGKEMGRGGGGVERDERHEREEQLPERRWSSNVRGAKGL